ncbi:hypothetical protein FPV67DRAFT_1461863 [Lyophyllum atratum]|nr:hypothetical protein FPV67DRAFT_1461863 [Lyophyllum atratum]
MTAGNSKSPTFVVSQLAYGSVQSQRLPSLALSTTSYSTTQRSPSLAYLPIPQPQRKRHGHQIFMRRKRFGYLPIRHQPYGWHAAVTDLGKNWVSGPGVLCIPHHEYEKTYDRGPRHTDSLRERTMDDFKYIHTLPEDVGKRHTAQGSCSLHGEPKRACGRIGELAAGHRYGVSRFAVSQKARGIIATMESSDSELLVIRMCLCTCGIWNWSLVVLLIPEGPAQRSTRFGVPRGVLDTYIPESGVEYMAVACMRNSAMNTSGRIALYVLNIADQDGRRGWPWSGHIPPPPLYQISTFSTGKHAHHHTEECGPDPNLWTS